MEMTDQIGPHNGRELELMLAGQKPMALFSVEINMPETYEGDDSGFAPYVQSGKILKFVEPFAEKNQDGQPVGETRYYCLPTEEWRVKLEIHIAKHCYVPWFRDIFSADDLHRISGALLGYCKDDVEYFINKIHSKSPI